MDRSPLGLHLPDADQLTTEELRAVLDLEPSALLCMVYTQWPEDKGAAEQVRNLVLSLQHDRLYVRFHADPHPPGYASSIGGARAWGRLCAERMAQYYGVLASSGVQLHAILANETDADYEGGLSTAEASSFYRRALSEYAKYRPFDVLHVPAPTGAPQTHREHLWRYKDDGWLVRHGDGGTWVLSYDGVVAPVWVDGHGYDGDLENVLNVLEEECPGAPKVITETNDLSDFGWPIALLAQQRVQDVIYFTLNWARGGEGRVRPPSPDDAAKRMSLLRFPDRYAQFKATIGQVAEPPEPEKPDRPEPPKPEEFPLPVDEHGNEWQASTHDVVQAIIDVAPREIDQDNPRRATKLLLALGLAESGSTPGQELQSQERWHVWTNHGTEAVRQRNLGYAAQVLGWGRDVGTIGTNDYSAGPFHQAWAWWDQFPGDPTDPIDPYRWDVMGWLRFRKLMIQDHGYATTYAARRMRPYYDQRPNDLQWVLERYNKPNEEVSAGVRANYARALEIAESWLQAWGWSEEGGTTPELPAPDPGHGTRFEDYTDPAPAGTFGQRPRGIILHGSRSGRASNPIAAEYVGTASYEVNNSAGLGWNATIGEDVVALHVDARRWGWNARAASMHYLAVEIAQPVEAVDVTDGQVRAFCDWVRQHVLPVWPDLPMHFPTHAEVEHSGETGVRDGKTDVFSYGSPRADELRARILANLNGGRPEIPETDQEKIARLISAVGYMGGDVADRLENVRAGVDDGMVRPSDTMTREEALSALAAWWHRWDGAYHRIGEVGTELRRVRDEQLGV